MTSACILFPHQLFEENPAIGRGKKVILVEEHLFFNQYHFHKMKLAFHRASMKYYEAWLNEKGLDVEYIDSLSRLSDVRKLIPDLASRGVREISYIDPVDDWLDRRIKRVSGESDVKLVRHDSPMFMNSRGEVFSHFENKKVLRQTDFYIHQRKKWSILIEEGGNPVGGKWTYDVENRNKYPRNEAPPKVLFPPNNEFYLEAGDYVQKHFPGHYGSLNEALRYPIRFEEVRQWLDQFLETRMAGFGTYQDAMVADEHWLHHSLISPMMNVGLITPGEVVERALKFTEDQHIPLNSLEGFIRQIVGWREFIRAVYELKGSRERTTNFWGFTRVIPVSFWNATTGIAPVDRVIQKVLKTGYAHHIERLMILGNFMVLCEFDPDEVYRWFMELFIDAYDWVMVPNVYGMSQFADGGLMATKPYISSSNYLMKMSNFSKGPWQKTWDALFWRFMHVHRRFFKQNPRMRMLINTFDRMDGNKRKALMKHAEAYLNQLR